MYIPRTWRWLCADCCRWLELALICGRISAGIRHMLRLAQRRSKRDKLAKAFGLERASLREAFTAKPFGRTVGS
jgi:hypothetical protein